MFHRIVYQGDIILISYIKKWTATIIFMCGLLNLVPVKQEILLFTVYQ